MVPGGPTVATPAMGTPAMSTPTMSIPNRAGTKQRRSLCNRRDVRPCQEPLVRSLAGSGGEPRSLCQAAPASSEMLQRRAWDWRCSFRKENKEPILKYHPIWRNKCQEQKVAQRDAGDPAGSLPTLRGQGGGVSGSPMQRRALLVLPVVLLQAGKMQAGADQEAAVLPGGASLSLPVGCSRCLHPDGIQGSHRAAELRAGFSV